MIDTKFRNLSGTKRIQFKHWASVSNKLYPHVFKLSELWSRAGIKEDGTALRIFRLETLFP